MAKLWAGRFGKETDLEVNDFNSSISFDCRLYKEDITGSMAHAAMLGKQGIIAQDEADRITEGLQGILQDIENGTIEFSQDYEDIHMNVEHILTERIGDAGKRLHTARSRNDQVALDLRMYVKKEIAAIKGQVLQFMKALCGSAKKNTETVMPGYTHLQRAQPVTFGHYMMAYANMMKRDVIRLENCLEGMDDMPLGSGALASTTYPIDRDFVRERLGFARITDNSLDGVSDRDYCVELCSALSILMMHLSRFSEEIIAWCSWEFKFVELDDAFSTGSSIMPQKKNPDVCELVRGKTGRVYGSLFTLLTALKGLPLAYNKDMQEDKEAVFDAIDTVKQCLRVLTPMFATMELRKDNMERAALKGFINATDCADYLTKKGMPFRDAYKTVGQLVGECVKRDCALSDLTLPELQAHSELFEADVYEAIDLKTCVRGRKAPGGPAPEEVSRQIAAIEAFIGKREE
ncbi:argininosuccinate lyase [Clostridiaceae bacterium]|nr:argininosuccinate lyase [Clostridiaceae bacterium]